MKIAHTEIILFVANQQVSTDFYGSLLGKEPVLNVEGMTEFMLSAHCTLGLMPNDGIYRLLGNKIEHPTKAGKTPRCELYLYVENLEEMVERAIAIGAKLVNETKIRDWGDTVCYLQDPDGHIIALARKN
ncbi:MAG: VOC family protein [Bacteroidia bacterium]